MNYLRPNDKRENILLLTCLAMALVLAVLLIAARRTAFFSERVELPLYDQVTRLVWPWTIGHEEIVLVTHQEPFHWEDGDLSFDWPVEDAALAAILGKIAVGKPSVIAIDLLRPEERPGSNPDGPALLKRVIADNDTIIWGFSLPTPEDPKGSSLPPCMDGIDDEELFRRSGILNFPEDGTTNKKVRRAYFAVLGRESETRAIRFAGHRAEHHCYREGRKLRIQGSGRPLWRRRPHLCHKEGSR